jgi:hypothetical protein
MAARRAPNFAALRVGVTEERHSLFNRFACDPEYRQLAEQRLAEARPG